MIQVNHGSKLNWYALCLTILSPKSITGEEALSYFGIKAKQNQSSIKNACSARVVCSDQVLNEMYELNKNGMNYKDIATKFNLGAEAVRVKIYRYKKKMGVI